MGTVVGNIGAVDDGHELAFVYAGESAADGSVEQQFRIEANGDITVMAAQLPTIGEVASYTFTVQVVDDGVPSMAATQTYTLNVRNRDLPPEQREYDLFIEENRTLEQQIDVAHPDQDHGLTFRLVDDLGGLFTLDPQTVLLTSTQPLDYEDPRGNDLRLQIAVTDEGPAGHTVTVGVRIRVQNVTRPATLPDAAFSVAEDAAPGTVVGTLGPFFEADVSGIGLAIASGNQRGPFAIRDAAGGTFELVVANPSALDFETQPQITLREQAVDANGQPVAGAASSGVTIDVTDGEERPVTGEPVVLVTDDGIRIEQYSGGAWTAVVHAWDDGPPAESHTGDFDGGGAIDLAYRADGTDDWFVRTNLADADASTTTFWGTFIGHESFVGDFDGDGRDDVAARTNTPTGTACGTSRQA